LFSVDFDCSNEEDGQHAFKNGDICQPRFVSCVGGVAWEMTCPDGLMFDPDQMLCERIDAILACGGTPAPETTTWHPTLAAEPTTLQASYGSYQAPAIKAVKPVSHIEKASYGSYQAPAVKAVKPLSHVEKASYGSYETPVAKPVHRMKALLTTTLAADNYNYQTEAPILAAEPITRRRSFDAYETEATTLRPLRKVKALLTTTPLADYGFELEDASETRDVFSSGYGSFDETPSGDFTTRRQMETTMAADQSYGSYQAPAADLVTRRHIQTTRLAALTTPASYGYQAPAIKAVKPLSHVQKTSYNSYQAPAEETTIMADLPTTASYGSYQAPAIKRVEKTSYQAPALKAFKPLEKASYSSYQAPAAEETTIMADLPTTASYGSYQAPAVKALKRVSLIEKAGYGSKKMDFAAPALKEQQTY
jgi:hypothetical protein